jgi:ATP-binding cassette subfamily B protein
MPTSSPWCKWRRHSAGAASRLAALLLPRILRDILGRRALRSGRIAALGATPPLAPRAAGGRPGRLGAYRRLFGYAAPYRAGWAAIVAATLTTTAVSLAQPWPLKVLVDHVLGGRPLQGWAGELLLQLPGTDSSRGLLVWVVAAGLVLFAINSVLEVTISLQWTRVGRRMVYDLARDLFARVQRRSLAAHTRHPVGDTIGRITLDAWCVHSIVDVLCIGPGHALITMVVMVTVMLQLDAGLTLLALGVAPCMVAAAWVFRKPMRDAAHARRDIESRLQAHVHQTLTSVPVVQAFTREDAEQRRFDELTSAAIRAHQRGALVGSAYALGSGLVTTLGTALVMWFAAMRVLDGRLTIGTALVFLAYLSALQWQLSAFATMYTTLQTAGAGVDRVMDVLTTDESVPERPGAPPLPAVRGDVVLEHVDFGYQDGAPVLQDVSLSAAAGDVVAIVGVTGAGKSSLVGLIPRFVDPSAGRVLIDGHDVRDVSLASLRDQVAVVLQEPFLFPVSIAENIALARPEAPREAIEHAARMANAHDFISALPQGYDTVLGERGGSLSGGERQRISIARAILKDAPILILDEPTSALDADTEHSVVEALDRLMRGRTTFIVAHRLSTIRRATTIVVLEGGRVAEQGPHMALLAKRGRYRAMYDRQFQRTEAAAS